MTTFYRITITRMDERPEWAAEHEEYLKSRRPFDYQNLSPPPRHEASPALTFDADERVFNAIRKAALESMP